MKPEHVHLALLNHLDIGYVLKVRAGEEGQWIREHHLYCPPALYQQLISFAVRHADKDRFQVHSNPPAPF